MTLSVAEVTEEASPLRGLLPLWVGVGVYALFLLAGNRLLIDPDTMWQVTIGQWIIDHRAVPTTDVYSFTMRGQPWISTQWLAQVLYAKTYAVAGWAGPVVLAASAIAATFALLSTFLNRRLSESTTLVFVAGALALIVPHLLARPHVLAMPVMVVWVGGLIAAADRRRAPSFWLLPLMALWANLHGGFVFGLFLIAPIALDAVVSARCEAADLAGAALGAVRDCGARGKLRHALWLERAAGVAEDFGTGQRAAADPGMEADRVRRPRRVRDLPAARHRAVAVPRHQAAADADPVAARPAAYGVRAGTRGGNPGAAGAAGAGGAAWPGRSAARRSPSRAACRRRAGVLLAGVGIALLAGTVAYASAHRFEPHVHSAPVAAVTELKKFNFTRVFNDYDFGGYLIANGVAPFIDGRTELYGEKFFVDHNAASGLMQPDNLFRLLDQYDIEATLMRTQSAATKLLDHMDGWQKVYSDDIATIHVRKRGAVHTVEPVVDPKTK